MVAAEVGSNSTFVDPCVAVIGTDRSGTSATAGLLVALGLTGPPANDLVPAGDSNTQGHWESRSVVKCNRSLLRAVGCTGFSPPPVTLDWDHVPDRAMRMSDARRWFEATYADRPMMVKDPRMCLTLPFWREALPAPMAAVLVLRNPLKVARSLEARDGLPMSLGLALWDRHMRSAALGLTGMPTFVIEYDRMLSDPLTGTAEVVEFLGQLRIAVSSEAKSRASTWFDARLRHQRSEIDEYADLAGVQQEMFLQLTSLFGFHDPWAPQVFPEPQLWIDDVIRLQRQIGFKSRELKRFRKSRTSQLASTVAKVRMHRSGSGRPRGQKSD